MQELVIHQNIERNLQCIFMDILGMKEKEKKITVYEPFKPSEVQQEEAPISGIVVVKTDQ